MLNKAFADLDKQQLKIKKLSLHFTFAFTYSTEFILKNESDSCIFSLYIKFSFVNFYIVYTVGLYIARTVNCSELSTHYLINDTSM